MYKKVLSLLLAGTLAVSLVACGSSDATTTTEGNNTSSESSTSEESTTTQAPTDATVVEVWTNDRHDLEYVEKMIAEYNSNNTDNLHINLTVITDDYSNMISLAYSGGTAPDLIGYASELVGSGFSLALNDYIAADEEFQLVNEPYDYLVEGNNVEDGNIYALFGGIRSGVRIQYNKDLLEACGYSEIPNTLEGYINMAKDVTEQGGGDFYGIGFTSSSPFERLLEMSAQMSGIYYYDYVNGQFNFDGYKEILELGQRYIAEDIAYPDQQGVDNMRALFTEGEFALWSNASQEAGVFTTQLPITEFEWGVAELPTLTGEISGALQMLLTKSYSIINTTKIPDEAWTVLSYFLSEEFLKGYLESGYCLPLSTYMREKIDTSLTGRLADFSTKDYESAYIPVPVISLTGDNYRTVLWNAVMGYVDIDDAIEDLNTRYNEALESGIASGTSKRVIISDYNPLTPFAGTVEYLSE